MSTPKKATPSIASPRSSASSTQDSMLGYVAIHSMTLHDIGGGKTKLVAMSLFHTVEERDGMMKSGMETGMNQSYEALDKVLESL
jgi:uncharacterized protein YndB with AHSA1/START domain